MKPKTKASQTRLSQGCSFEQSFPEVCSPRKLEFVRCNGKLEVDSHFSRTGMLSTKFPTGAWAHLTPAAIPTHRIRTIFVVATDPQTTTYATHSMRAMFGNSR
jgi:hypothetical protein